MFIAHGSSGLTIAYLTKKIWDKEIFTSKEKALLFSSSIISAELPDFDLAYTVLDGFSHHHSYITHVPLPYITISLLIFCISFIFKDKKRKFIQSFSFIFFITTFLHMITDSFAGQIRFFFPLSKKGFTLFTISSLIRTPNIILAYFATPLFSLIELSSISSALFILFHRLKNNKMIFTYTSLTLLISSIIAITATILLIILLWENWESDELSCQ